MAKVIKYKGYNICQTENNHVWATKCGRMVLHAQCDKRLSKDELKVFLDNVLNICSEAQGSSPIGE